MSRIFLSYARDDVDAAKQLAEGISEAGHDVWWDRNLHGGSRFDTEIDEALENAEAVVVLWSKASVGSAWVKDEAGEGRDSGRLVPVALDSAKPPLGFRQFQTINLGAWDGHGRPQALAELLDGISRTCGSDARQAKLGTSEEDKLLPKISICVLPFSNMSGEAEQEYFSDGISEDIITDLSKVSALSVVARNTAFGFKGQNPNVREVAQALGVNHVLEGSVRKAGNRVRITAQLIDGSAGDHLWADRYDRDLTDIFEIQDEISKAIVDALKVRLLPQEKKAIESRGTSNTDAYNLYLLARHQWVSGNAGNPRRDEGIVRVCKQATALDPNYAHPWALMALAQAELRFTYGRDENALPAAERAIELNPSLPEAHCIKARYLEDQGKSAEAEKQIRTAIQLDSNSWEVNREAARMLFRRGHNREAIPFFEKAASLVESDWHNPMMLLACYTSSGEKGRYDDAARVTLERSERAVAKDPTNGMALAAGAQALVALGNNERAREWLQRALLLDPDNLMMRYNAACVFAQDENASAEALDALDEFLERAKTAENIRHLEADPDLNSLRDMPRFKEIVASAKKRLAMEVTGEN